MMLGTGFLGSVVCYPIVQHVPTTERKISANGKRIARIHHPPTSAESVASTDNLPTSEKTQNIKEKSSDIMMCSFVPFIMFTSGGFNFYYYGL